MNIIPLRILSRLAVASIALSLGACAVGNRYDYRNSIEGLPVSGTQTIAVDVIDARPYVLSGDKTPEFVGIQRGGFGNPFDVKTASGAPLADEMRTGIVNALQKKGFTVPAPGTAAPRKMELRVLEWKTDVMARMKVLYDMKLSIFDDQGKLLAQSAAKGEDVLGGGLEAANSGNAAKSFELRFSEMVRDEQVKAALTGAAR